MPQRVIDAIVAHASRTSPHECCGLLIGNGDLVTEAVATHNVAGDSLRRYEISPIDYLSEISRCRALAAPRPGVIGAYHSHPRGAPEPSPTDIAQAFSNFLFVIAGPVNDSVAIDIRGYRLHNRMLEEVCLEGVGPIEPG